MALSVGPKDERDIDDCSSGEDEIDEIDLKDEVVWERITENYPKNSLIWFNTDKTWDYESTWYDVDNKTTTSWGALYNSGQAEQKNIIFAQVDDLEIAHTVNFDSEYLIGPMIILGERYAFDAGNWPMIPRGLEINAECTFDGINLLSQGNVNINANTTFNTISRSSNISGNIIGDGHTLILQRGYICVNGEIQNTNLNLIDIEINATEDMNIPVLTAQYKSVINSNGNIVVGTIDVSNREYVIMNGDVGVIKLIAQGENGVTLTDGINFGELSSKWTSSGNAPISGNIYSLQPANNKLFLTIDIDVSNIIGLSSTRTLRELNALCGRYYLVSGFEVEDASEYFNNDNLILMQNKLNEVCKQITSATYHVIVKIYFESGSLILEISLREEGSLYG